MASSPDDLQQFDQLMGEMGRALADQDWARLSELNGQVQSKVEPLMAALAAQELDATEVRTRLEEMQQLVDAASQGANKARQEAKAALKGVNQNRTAAKAYQNISSNRPK